MATMLRYVRYLRQSGRITRRLNISQCHVDLNTSRLKLPSSSLTNLTKFYTTDTTVSAPRQFFSFEKALQGLELQVQRYGRASKTDIEKVLSEVQLTGHIPSLEALLLVRSCGKPLIDQNSEESIKLVQEIWDTLERLKTPLDVSHYNALLGVYLEKEYEFSPAEFLEKMLQEKIEPNRVTYQRLLARYCQLGDIPGATRILEHMREKGIPICEEVFNSLITGHSQAGDMESAIGILKVMENAGIPPSGDTYSALLCAYAKRGDMDAINETLKKLETGEICITDRNLMEVIESFAVNGHTEKAKEFSQRLPKEISSDSEVGRLLAKLTEIKQHKLAITILKNTISDPARHAPRVSIILRIAVLSGRYTMDEIIELCHLIEKDNLHPRCWSLLLYNILANRPEPSLAIPLMRLWRERGGEIREHFFWPLLRAEARSTNFQGLIDIVKTMITEFQTMPSLDTLRDYVVPFMFGTWEHIIGQLLSLKVPRQHILEAIASRVVKERKLRNAAMFMTSYPSTYPLDLAEPMADSLILRLDLKPMTVITRFLGKKGVDIDVDNTPVEVVDKVLDAVMNSMRKFKSNIVEAVVREFYESGLSMSPAMGERILAFLGEHKSPGIDEIIQSMTSGKLKQVPMDEYNPYLKADNDYIRRPQSVVVNLRTQFAYNVEQKNEEKVLELLQQLDAHSYSSGAVLAQALNLFCETGNIQAAEQCYNKFKETPQDRKLDNMKILSYVQLLLKNNRLQEAIDCLNETTELTDHQKFGRNIRVKVRELMETIAETKDVDNIYRLFDLLKSKNFLEMDNFTLGPLVKLHITSNDLDKALETFERLCKEYKCTPSKNLLAAKFIEAEDANSLQKMTDLCTEIHGESNALVDLAMTFLELGKPRQAQKILETPGIQIFNTKITSAVKHFKDLNEMQCLEQLAKLSRGVLKMNRNHLYNTLLEVYSEQNDWQRGLALWLDMQEEDIQPTTYFLSTLSHLLKKNNQPVPFVMSQPNDSIKSPQGQVSLNARQLRRKASYPDDAIFNRALENRDWSSAQNIIDNSMLSRMEVRGRYGRLCRAMSRNGEVDRAFDLMRTVIQKFGAISQPAFVEVCNKMIEAGKYDEVIDIGVILPQEAKKYLHYPRIRAVCEIRKYGLRKFIESVDIPLGSTVERSQIDQKLPYGAMVEGLLADPTYVKEYEQWARKLADVGVGRAVQVLWNYHVINNSAKAEELWNEYIVKVNSPLVRPIVGYARQHKDPLLLKKLLKKMESHPTVSIDTSCRIFSGLIAVYNSLEQYDEALQVLNEATKRYRLKLLARAALQDLKEGLESTGKTFPYIIETEETEMDVDKQERRMEGSAVA